MFDLTICDCRSQSRICPVIESVQTIEGCHSCSLAAKIVLRAKSICQSGSVSVSFNAIPLSSRAITLSTDSSLVDIQFLTSQRCHKERVCLSHNEIKSFDDPILSLTQRNMTGSSTTALAQSSGLFDQISMTTTSIGTSIKQYLIWFLAILASIFTLSFVVTLFKR